MAAEANGVQQSCSKAVCSLTDGRGCSRAGCGPGRPDYPIRNAVEVVGSVSARQMELEAWIYSALGALVFKWRDRSKGKREHV